MLENVRHNHNKINTMIIDNLKDYNNALFKVQKWLQKGEYNADSYKEIEDWMKAIENYTGMTLPARSFIQTSCLSSKM